MYSFKDSIRIYSRVNTVVHIKYSNRKFSLMDEQAAQIETPCTKHNFIRQCPSWLVAILAGSYYIIYAGDQIHTAFILIVGKV